MAVSFAVPVIDGTPISTDAYIADATRSSAVRTDLATYIAIDEDVIDDVPSGARPLIAYLLDRQRDILHVLDADEGTRSLRDSNSLFLEKLGDSESWPGLRAFVTVAAAHPDCEEFGVS